MKPSQTITGPEKEILDEETRLRDARAELTKRRATLVPEAVTNYSFLKAGTGEVVTLSDLFAGREDLILIHNMGGHCPGCTMWADELNGSFDHLWNRAAFAVVSNDTPQAQAATARKRGWRFPLVSARGTAYSKEAGFEAADDGYGVFRPGVTAYAKKDGQVFRTNRSYFGPGDEYCGAWNLTTLLEGGNKGWFSKLAYPQQQLPERPGYEALDHYMQGWSSGDFARMESALGVEFQFTGPMATHRDTASFMASCKQMAQDPNLRGATLENVHKFYGGNTVGLFYDMVLADSSRMSLAEKFQFDDSGKIRDIQLAMRAGK